MHDAHNPFSITVMRKAYMKQKSAAARKKDFFDFFVVGAVVHGTSSQSKFSSINFILIYIYKIKKYLFN